MYRLLLILLMCSLSFSEELDPNVVPCEGTCFSAEEVQNMFDNIKALEFKRETCESAYANLESQIKDYDKLTMDYEESVKLCEVQIKIKEDMIKTIKPKWYDNKYLWYSMGVASMILPIWGIGQLSK